MAPLPSEAVPPMPTLTIDGTQVTDLEFYGEGCGTGTTTAQRQAAPTDTGFNACWSIPLTNVTTESTRSATRRVGNWYVGDVTATNQARVLIFDLDTGTDDMKLTGTTLTPVVTTSETDVSLVNTFNQPGGGNPGGAYFWIMSQGGNVDPYPDTINTCTGSGVKLTGTANIGDSNPGNLGILQKYASLNCPTLPKGAIGNITENNKKTAPATNSVKKLDGTTEVVCNVPNTFDTRGVPTGKCAPTVTYTYHVKIVGGDQVQLTDSVVGCGKMCYRDDGEGGGANGTDGGPNLNCLDPVFLAQCVDKIDTDTAADVDAGIKAGAVESCGAAGNCIFNMVEVTPANKGVGLLFTFTASGPGVDSPLSPFTVTTNAQAFGGHLSKDLLPTVDPRIFRISTYPKGWQADQIQCESALNNGTTTWTVAGGSVKGPLTVNTLGAGDILTCSWHIHHDTK
jgi:hypothetical protein